MLPDSQRGKLKTKPDVGLPYHTSGCLARGADIETRSARMYRRIGSKLLIATAAGLLSVLPASACDGCACGGAGYGYYGYGPSWGYSSAYVVAPALVDPANSDLVQAGVCQVSSEPTSAALGARFSGCFCSARRPRRRARKGMGHRPLRRCARAGTPSPAGACAVERT